MGAKFSTSCNLFRKPCSSFTHWSLKNSRRYDKKTRTKYSTLMSWDLGIEAVFWIWNELVRIRIPLYRSFRILLFNILSEQNGIAARFIEHFKDFLTEILTNVIKDQSDHFADIFAKIIQIFLSKRSDPDPTWTKCTYPNRIRIHNTEARYLIRIFSK